MPVPVIKKEAEKHGVSKEHAEAKWEEAKAQAAKEGFKEDWAYIMTIFKNMMKDKK
jgi:hypothetical protein